MAADDDEHRAGLADAAGRAAFRRAPPHASGARLRASLTPFPVRPAEGVGQRRAT